MFSFLFIFHLFFPVFCGLVFSMLHGMQERTTKRKRIRIVFNFEKGQCPMCGLSSAKSRFNISFAWRTKLQLIHFDWVFDFHKVPLNISPQRNRTTSSSAMAFDGLDCNVIWHSPSSTHTLTRLLMTMVDVLWLATTLMCGNTFCHNEKKKKYKQPK